MKYRYRHNRYLVYTKTNDGKVLIRDANTQDEWTCTMEFAKFLKMLDGTVNPFHVDSPFSYRERVMLLRRMRKDGLIVRNKKYQILESDILIPLYVPNVTNKMRLVGRVWNQILLYSFLPVFLMGVYVLFHAHWLRPGHVWSGFLGGVIGIFGGLVVHEFSHAASCVGYGKHGHFFEMGLMFYKKIFFGGYVAIDYCDLKSRLHKAQICAAGIESNVLLAGVFLLLLLVPVLDPMVLLTAAFDNVFLGLLNLLPVGELDGFWILSELFER